MKNNSLFKTSLINGVVVGLILSVITFIIYLADINMFGIATGISIFVINITILIVAFVYTMKKVRANSGEKGLSYVKRLTVGVIVGVISGWIATLTSYIIFQIIDPNFISGQLEGFIDTLINLGVSEDEAIETVDKMREDFTTMGQLKNGLIKTPLVYIVISMIIAAFVRKDIESKDSLN